MNVVDIETVRTACNELDIRVFDTSEQVDHEYECWDWADSDDNRNGMSYPTEYDARIGALREYIKSNTEAALPPTFDQDDRLVVELAATLAPDRRIAP